MSQSHPLQSSFQPPIMSPVEISEYSVFIFQISKLSLQNNHSVLINQQKEDI